MILIVTNEKDYTADYLILELHRRKLPFFRLNTERFPEKVRLTVKLGVWGSGGELQLGERWIAFDEITSVWYRRPVTSEPSSMINDPVARDFIEVESGEVITGLRYLLDSFWVSHPDNIRAAESKLHQLQVATSIGFSIPDTIVTNSAQIARDFLGRHNDGVICKPLRYSRLIRDDMIRHIYTTVVTSELANEIDAVSYSPTLFQSKVSKKSELRITVVGKKVFAVELDSQVVPGAQDDWRRVNAKDIKYLKYALPLEIEQRCVRLVETLGLNFGAIDMVVTPDDRYVFLEINPNGQWAWLEFVCPGIDIRKALVDLLSKGGDGVA